MKDSYQSISDPSEGEYKEKGSKFLAYAYPVTTEEEVQLCLDEVKGMHIKARHHCYAYRIGITGELHRANDDGEPSGTAGRPILGQLLSHEVSDILVVVVRYFGGTLLGASGLIQAYRAATIEALAKANIITKVISDVYRLTFDYAEMGHVLNVVKNQDLNIINKVFEAEAYIDIEVRASQTEQSLLHLKAGLLNVSTEQIEDDTSIPFCSIEKIRTSC